MKHKDAIQASPVVDHQLKVVTGRFNKLRFAGCAGFYQEGFCVADNPVCFGENQAESLV